jgi:hypothetical protein
MAQPPSPPALIQELQNLFESPSVAYTAVVSLRDQCILYQESAQSFFSTQNRTRLDGSSAAPHPPASKEVDRWLAAACGAASPFLETTEASSSSGDGERNAELDAASGWHSATFNAPKWDIIAYRCDAQISRDESASSPTGSTVGAIDVQQHHLLMVTFRSKTTSTK